MVEINYWRKYKNIKHKKTGLITQSFRKIKFQLIFISYKMPYIALQNFSLLNQ